MCTLILAWQVFDDAPVAAAANRDEALGRPSRPPGVLNETPRVVAPRDEEAGGTWIGYNDAGLFVAITNRRTDIEGERSRGLLVRDALTYESASDAGSFVRTELADRQYAGFNLVLADAEEAGLLEWDGVLRTTHFDPGVHVVVNEGHDDDEDDARKTKGIREAVRPDPETTAEAWFHHATTVLSNHDLDACVHGDGYGTRSSSLVAIDADGDGRYWFADGKPCVTDYEVVAVEGGASAREAEANADDADGHI
ncbi:NRDE family protein [Halorussus pelagicus]|uniref:NRDE family protein n=1 Tax=Halorussus pelagicus TaxID=2505977 RepID=UPI000FFC337E|nr:NRDE family protein [Halorussus pelagicus]